MRIDRWVGLGAVLAGCAAVFGAHADDAAPKAIVEVGSLERAPYRIDVPVNWNHELIVYYHGYTDQPVTFSESEKVSPMFDPMLKEGYALIQSGYSGGGWAVEEGYADTEKLRKKFIAAHGAPKRSYVMGMSMGGALTAMTIEQRADTFNGALSLCGVLEPSNRMLQRDFALRAAFDYYFPGLLGELVPVPADYHPNAAMEHKIADALNSKQDAARALVNWYGAAGPNNFVPVILFAGYEVRELQQRTHGNPFGNADLIYMGSGDDFNLNNGVRRYRADPRAAVYIAKWYTPTGKLTRPFLALHDTGDPLVPANSAFEYALQVERAGHADNFVQLYVNREGHCVFTPEEIGLAFDKLVAWSESGKRPEAGKLE